MRRAEHTFTYAKCGACDVHFLKERPTEETVSFFYEGDYGPYGRSSRKRVRLPARLNRKLLKFADKLLGVQPVARRIEAAYDEALAGGGKVLLDFGCGAGRFLDRARRRYRAQTVGMDFNDTVLSDVAARGHQTHIANEAGWNALAPGGTDMVRMNHVLEHLYHPRDVLARFIEILRPGGWLHLEVPNPAGFSAARYGNQWFGLECPRHIILYPPVSLERLLRDAGFDQVEVIGMPVVRDLVRSRARAAGDEDVDGLKSDGPRALINALRFVKGIKDGGSDRLDAIARKPA